MPRSLTNAYWIEVGVQRERMRIVELLKQHQCKFTDVEVIECWCGSFNEAIEIIKADQISQDHDSPAISEYYDIQGENK